MPPLFVSRGSPISVRMGTMKGYAIPWAASRWAATAMFVSVVIGSNLGCEGDREGGGLGVLEERLRPGEERRGKVGSLRGWEIVYRAHRVAEAIERGPDPACALDEMGPLALELEFEISRYRGDDLRQRWLETRTYFRDEGGSEEVSMRAEFRTEIGLDGVRQGRWIRREEGTYVEEAPGKFSHRPGDVLRGESLHDDGPGFVDALLDAVGAGWQRDRSDDEQRRWRATGGVRLRCSRSDGKALSRAWKDRLALHAGAVIEGRFEVRTKRSAPGHGEADDPGEEVSVEEGRSLEVQWRLNEGERLVLRYVDRILLAPVEAIEAPQRAFILGRDRDSSHNRIDEALETWMKKGWIERKPWPPAEDEEK